MYPVLVSHPNRISANQEFEMEREATQPQPLLMFIPIELTLWVQNFKHSVHRPTDRSQVFDAEGPCGY